jgi:hypothetical protein
LRAAAEADMAIVLESPPDAARYLGAPYFLAMIEAARAEVPDTQAASVLDCGDAAGLALDALRHGARAVRLLARDDVLARVADIAGQMGAIVEAGPSPGDALDLGVACEPLDAARNFLAARRRETMASNR